MGGARMRSSTPVGERAGGSQRAGPSGSLSAGKSPEKVAMVSGRQRGTAEASASESSVALSVMLGTSSAQEGGQTSTPGPTVTPGLDATLQPQDDVPTITAPSTYVLVTSGEQTLRESTTAQVAVVTPPEADPELMSRLLREAREKMPIQAEQAEQQRVEFKHQIVKKRKK